MAIGLIRKNKKDWPEGKASYDPVCSNMCGRAGGFVKVHLHVERPVARGGSSTLAISGVRHTCNYGGSTSPHPPHPPMGRGCGPAARLRSPAPGSVSVGRFLVFPPHSLTRVSVYSLDYPFTRLSSYPHARFTRLPIYSHARFPPIRVPAYPVYPRCPLTHLSAYPRIR